MTPDDYLETLLEGKLDVETEVDTQPDSATESTDSNDDKISVNSSESKELNWLEDLEQLVEKGYSTNSPNQLKSKISNLTAWSD